MNNNDPEAKEEAGTQAIASKVNKKKKTQKSPSTSTSLSQLSPASPEQGLLHQAEEKEGRIETELKMNENSNNNNGNDSRNSNSFIIEDVEVGDSEEKEDGEPISSFLNLSPASNIYPVFREGKGKEGKSMENATTSISPDLRKDGFSGNLRSRDLSSSSFPITEVIVRERVQRGRFQQNIGETWYSFPTTVPMTTSRR
jgi:hypothetical protein